MNNHPKEKGIILILTMLFLSIASMLAVSLLNITLLENKTNNYYTNKLKAFYKAEELLIKYENEVINHNNMQHAEIIDDESVCGATFYRVTAFYKYGKISSKLQSVVAKTSNKINNDTCNKAAKNPKTHQSFVVIDQPVMANEMLCRIKLTIMPTGMNPDSLA
jgi:Tfp pilus assembly protein PilX